MLANATTRDVVSEAQRHSSLPLRVSKYPHMGVLAYPKGKRSVTSLRIQLWPRPVQRHEGCRLRRLGGRFDAFYMTIATHRLRCIGTRRPARSNIGIGIGRVRRNGIRWQMCMPQKSSAEKCGSRGRPWPPGFCTCWSKQEFIDQWPSLRVACPRPSDQPFAKYMRDSCCCSAANGCVRPGPPPLFRGDSPPTGAESQSGMPARASSGY
jgi:hypothetical protein